MTSPTRTAYPQIPVFLACIATVLGMAIIAATDKMGILDHGMAQRAAGALLGLVVIVAGNYLPKFGSTALEQDEAMRAVAADRFAGQLLVLSGFSYSLLWFLADPAEPLIRFLALGAGLVGMIGAAAAIAAGYRHNLKTLINDLPASRHAIHIVLISACWGFAIFATDLIWGDAVAQWMAISFPLLFGAGAGLRAYAGRDSR
ncbi:hypothetical protein [Cucumibacter marinus]|uniref:hypothetical protein n=1 Tax=Cucumibacter marinus TaxID=1121252 RepID=UPI00041C2E9D|nr:hypothetical protein [Cucumibacter marinus]